ncbi:DUF6174 domain-containing protein [Agaribacterium sp. ZY112]|uniref:DUF6174 domain-containing protein n=1 Tax=Agaribacterium sp. ZY112 TaxID=3233574 RepID=UPI003523E2C6
MFKFTAILLVLLSQYVFADLSVLGYQPYTPEEIEGKANPSLWKKYNFSSYSYLIKNTHCWCPSGLTRVYVVEGKVVDFEEIEYFSAMKPQLKDLQTIDKLISKIDSYYQKHPSTFNVRFDPSFGFPSEFFVDPEFGTFDDEFGFQILEVVPLKRSGS